MERQREREREREKEVRESVRERKKRMGHVNRRECGKRLKLILYKKEKKSSKCLPNKKKKKKNLTCPVDRDHLCVMESHSKFRIAR